MTGLLLLMAKIDKLLLYGGKPTETELMHLFEESVEAHRKLHRDDGLEECKVAMLRYVNEVLNIADGNSVIRKAVARDGIPSTDKIKLN